jgi:hypothetical protein
MIALITLLLGSVLAAPASRSPAIAECTLGRVVLTDLSPSPGEADFLIDADQIQSGSLFALCPDLLSSLPPKIRIASKAEAARVRELGSPDPVLILYVDAPEISRSGRTAVVSYSYICNGLCGEGYRVRYKVAGGVWMRAGKEKRLWVS